MAVKVEIIEYDKDYGTITDIFTKFFDSKEEANRYCKMRSWSGYEYSIRKLESNDLPTN